MLGTLKNAILKIKPANTTLLTTEKHPYHLTSPSTHHLTQRHTTSQTLIAALKNTINTQLQSFVKILVNTFSITHVIGFINPEISKYARVKT